MNSTDFTARVQNESLFRKFDDLKTQTKEDKARADRELLAISRRAGDDSR